MNFANLSTIATKQQQRKEKKETIQKPIIKSTEIILTDKQKPKLDDSLAQYHKVTQTCEVCNTTRVFDIIKLITKCKVCGHEERIEPYKSPRKILQDNTSEFMLL